MKNNNKGLSLVELVIVISIMSALTALMSIGLSSTVSRPAEECAQKVVSSLKLCRINAMGKQSSVIELSQSAEGAPIMMQQVISDTTPGAATKIGEKGVSFAYHVKGADEDAYVKLSQVNKIVLSFDRSTGGFSPVIVDAAGSSNEISADAGKYIDKILISKGSLTKELTLAYLTGKVQIK